MLHSGAVEAVANLLESYLRDLRETKSTGSAVPETSYYPALRDLLNGVGATLKPKVRCVIHISHGAGIPDGGLFTPDQFQKGTEPLPGTIPSRGAIEAKATSDDTFITAKGKQVSKYWDKYRQVLVTNYRDFLLVGADKEGKQVALESYRLAPNEKAFWSAAAHPQTLANEQGEAFTEFLRRVMLHAAPLGTPQDVAWFLASYAREALRRVGNRKLPALTAIRGALEEALGIKFEGEKGEHFFRSTLIQTLFYGVFSAWVLWAREHPPSDTKARFDWRTAAFYLLVPVLRKLFREVTDPEALASLALSEVLDWTGTVLNRVDRSAFFSAFQEHHAVQYFYEPFLEAYDPDLRKQLGVWYTPHEVVSYMVERVDRVLREELNLADGLADPNVFVLDPCCGTGSYLIEVLHRIATTLKAKGGDALSAQEVKKAAIDRVFGFEILPAPFVVSHLQIGLMLQSLGAPFSEKKSQKERASVYLTNALTGWEPPDGTKPQMLLAFPELLDEREAAERVKREAKILVVIGNPPYNGFAGLAMAEERDLSDAYRTTKRVARPQGQGLNDLYVRFYRMAERRIVEKTHKGIVCFISNYSWLDGLSFTGMRERYLDVFDRIWIDCLNGDKYKTGKLTPEGEPDPSIFSTEHNREGIQVVTAIALLLRRDKSAGTSDVEFRNLWGKAKREQLLLDSNNPSEAEYESNHPALGLGLSFQTGSTAVDYLAWPLLPDLFPVSFPGVKTSRDFLVVDIDRDRLIERMQQYFDSEISDADFRALVPAAMEDSGRFDAKKTRRYLVNRGFKPENIVRYCYRPFDNRWLYWEPETKLLDEKRSEYFPHVFEENLWFSAGQRNRKEAFYQPQITTLLADHHLVESNVGMFPLFTVEQGLLAGSSGSDAKRPNVSSLMDKYLRAIKEIPSNAFLHAVAILHSTRYRNENSTALRQNWPRIPLPASGQLLATSAELGTKIAALLDPDKATSGVTSSKIRPELKVLAVVAREGGGNLDPDAGDLDVKAGWGHFGQGGAIMPGKGRAIEREYTSEEREAIATGAKPLGMLESDALGLLGGSTFDVYLNNVAYWKNVPSRIWEYTIGGYQVVKKWLSYREYEILGRSLKMEEVYEVRDMLRRIAAILLLQPALDANYEAVKKATYQWPGNQ
jgi:hypothetical protein